MTYRSISLAVVFAGLLTASVTNAQVTSETANQAMRLSVFGVGSYARPDFGSQKTGSGFAVGGGLGFTVHLLHGLEPALDVRYSYASNSALSESVFSGGPRIIYHVARFHPYADLLVGAGNINFKNVQLPSTYTHDNSLVYTYGGGVDVDLTRAFAVRVDVQQGHWKLEQGAQPFHPTQASVGLRYQFHFHSKHGPE